MALTPQQKTMIFVSVGVLIVLVVAGLIAMHMMKPKAKSVPAPVAPAPVAPAPVVPAGPSINNPQLVPAGQSPADGQNFVIASALTGKYITDSGDLSNDINNAKVFTYDSKLGQTNEKLQGDNVVINSVGQKSLIGPNVVLSGNLVYSAFFVNGDAIGIGTVNYNPSAALNGYYDAYGVKFYYV